MRRQDARSRPANHQNQVTAADLGRHYLRAQGHPLRHGPSERSGAGMMSTFPLGRALVRRSGFGAMHLARLIRVRAAALPAGRIRGVPRRGGRGSRSHRPAQYYGPGVVYELSNISLEQLRHAATVADIVCVQNLFHLADRGAAPSRRVRRPRDRVRAFLPVRWLRGQENLCSAALWSAAPPLASTRRSRRWRRGGCCRWP